MMACRNTDKCPSRCFRTDKWTIINNVQYDLNNHNSDIFQTNRRQISAIFRLGLDVLMVTDMMCVVTVRTIIVRKSK